MSFWLQCLASMVTCWEWIRDFCNSLRVKVFVPNVIHAGHTMILTPAGYWTPVHGRGPQVAMLTYDATTHRVVGSASPAAWTRWAWIGAVGSNGTDYGDFFADLRVERGRVLTPAQAVALAVHQTGCWPGVTLRITTRMGEEQEVLAATGEPAPAAASSSAGAGAGAAAGEPTRYPELNYIR